METVYASIPRRQWIHEGAVYEFSGMAGVYHMRVDRVVRRRRLEGRFDEVTLRGRRWLVKSSF